MNEEIKKETGLIQKGPINIKPFQSKEVPIKKIQEGKNQEKSLMTYYDHRETQLEEALKKLKPEEVDLTILKDIYNINDYEIKIIEKIAEKKTNKEIAEELYRARPAIDNIIKKCICRKLGVDSKYQILHFVQLKLRLYI